MPEEVNAANGEAAQDQNPPTGGQGAPPNQPEYVTRENMQEYERRLNGISASLRNISEALSKQQGQQAPNTQQGAGGEKGAKMSDGAETELAQRIASIEQREAKMRAASEVTLIRQAVLEAGVPKDRINTAIKVLQANTSGKVTLSEDAQQLTINPENELHGPKPIGDFVKLWLESDEGRIFLPPKASPNVPAGYNSPDGSHPWKAKTAKEIQVLAADNPAMFRDYVQNHASEWRGKIDAL